MAALPGVVEHRQSQNAWHDLRHGARRHLAKTSHPIANNGNYLVMLNVIFHTHAVLPD